MPFKKVGNNDYTSPSGRHFNQAQVRLYYANGGHFPGEKGYAEGGIVNKGYMGKVEAFAAGGPVLGRTRDFMKQSDRFRDQKFQPSEKTDDVFGKGTKGGVNAAPPAKGKSLPAVKPRS